MDRKKRDFRLWIQAGWAALTNGYAAGFLKGRIYQGDTKVLCVPGLNCYSCPGALGSCPIGSLQAVLADRNYQISFYVLGFLMIFGALFGRLVCGFLCPFGLFQDLLYRIRIRGLKKIKNLPGHKWLRWMKYLVLAVFVILLPLFAVNVVGIGSPWFCKYLCPSGTAFAGLPLLASNEGLREAAGKLFSWKLCLLIGVILLSVKVHRPFCKYVCPLGAVYGWFHPVALYHFQIDEKKCISCGACQKICRADIKVWENPNSLECIRCGDCIRICPEQAIETTARTVYSMFAAGSEKSAENGGAWRERKIRK